MSFVLPPILHLQLVTLPAIRAAHLSTGGGKDRDRHSGENLYNSSKDYTWRNDYDTFGHTNIDFQQQNRQSANSQSPVALPSTKMIESNIADYDTEVGFTDSVDSSDDRGINRSKDRELSIDSHGFEDDEDQPLLTSSQTNSQSKSQSQLQPYNSRNHSLSGRTSTNKADIISSTTQKSKSTPSNHHHNTINTTSSSMKDGMTDDYSISMTRPWLSPYKQRVLDWVLIIAGVFMCIFGTTVTFLQIMNQFNHSHIC